jgi:hypothetical protein
MDDAMYRAALIVFHHELGLPLIEAGRLASAVVVWSAETPKARAAALEEHGAALRSTGTGRSEAEAEEAELPAGEPITEEASGEAIAVAQAIEAAIQVRGIFSYAPDGRLCLTWYGEQRIAKVIDAHLEDEPKTGRSEAEAKELIARARYCAKHEASSVIDLPDGRVRYEAGFPEKTLYGRLADALEATAIRAIPAQAAGGGDA